MRAFYVPSLEQNMSLKDDQAHHGIKVLRLKVGEQVLLLDGKGKKAKYEISELKKKEIIITEIETIETGYESKIHLAVGKVKKDALSTILKQACELAVDKIYIYESSFSQNYSLNLERLQKILISGIEQSNFAFLPEIVEIKFDELPLQEYKQFIYFSSQTQSQVQTLNDLQTLLVIGPEGGLSEDEEKTLSTKNHGSRLHLETAIMRSPTAVACAAGYFYGKLNIYA